MLPLAPPEKRALRQIVQVADILEVNGKTYLLAEVSERTIDILAAFEAHREDMEPDDPGGEDSFVGHSVDYEENGDREEDEVSGRKRYILDRTRVVRHRWRRADSGAAVECGQRRRIDPGRDARELKRVKTFVADASKHFVPMPRTRRSLNSGGVS